MIGSSDLKWLGLAWFGGVGGLGAGGGWGGGVKRGVSLGFLLHRLYCSRGFAVRPALLLDRLYC